MKLSCLKNLTCVKNISGHPCKGNLIIENNQVPLTMWSPTDILEGIIRCTKCGNEYPILGGVGIVVPLTETYIRQNYAQLCIFLDENHYPISHNMAQYFRAKKLNIPLMAQQPVGYDHPRYLSRYVATHYPNYGKFLIKHEMLAPLLEGYEKEDLYTTLVSLLTKNNIHPNKVLDMGCSVGRMSFGLANIASHVYGLDHAFPSVFTARQILSGMPSKKTTHPFFYDGLQEMMLEFDIDNLENIEFIVGDATATPLQIENFDLICIVNILDGINSPRNFLEGVLTQMANNSYLIFSSCYHWDIEGLSPKEDWIDGKEATTSSQELANLLKEYGSIIEEKDPVMWICPENARSLSIFLNHCILFQRKHSF